MPSLHRSLLRGAESYCRACAYRLGYCHGHAVSTPARATGPGFHHAQKPRPDGFHAHGARGPCPGLSAPGGLFRRAGGGRRGVDRHRRYSAKRRRLGGAIRLAADQPPAAAQAPPGDRRGARGRRQDLHANPALWAVRLPSFHGVFERHPVAHHAFQAPCAQRERRGKTGQRLRARHPARARSRLRRRGSHGLGRVLHQPVHRSARQPPQR